MTRPQTRVAEHARTRDASGPEHQTGPLATTGEVTGLNGYEATRNFRLWFRAYDRPRRGGPTHSVHIVLPAPSGYFTLVELWQGPLTKLIRDAVTQGYMVKAAEVEQVGQLELFAGVGA